MSKIYFDPLTRRNFIYGLGGFVALPLLSSLIPEKALAASTNKKRFIAITTPNQLPSSLVFPNLLAKKTFDATYASQVKTFTEGNFNYRDFSLMDIATVRGKISDLIDAKYNPYLSKMAIYRGVDMPGRVDHGRATSLGNLAGSHLGNGRKYTPMRTMDEFLANSTNFYSGGKVAYRFPILRVGESPISTSMVTTSNPNQGLGIGGNNASLTMNGNLKQIFDRMFSNDQSSPQKAPVVDRILTSANELKSKGKLSTDDRHRLDEYMATLSQLQSSISSISALPAIPQPNLVVPNYSTAGMGGRGDAVTAVSDYYAKLAELLVLAIKCGSTKLAVVGVDSALRAAADCVTQATTWHLEVAHANNYPQLLAVHKFIMDRVFFEIMKGLNAPESGGETYLDNTLLWMTSECSYGHSGINFSGIFAGNSAAGSGFGVGRGYDFADWTKGFSQADGITEIAPGQPINRMWVGILHSLGLNPQDYLDKFGNGSKTFGIWEQYENGFEGEFGDVYRSQYVANSLPKLFTK